MDTKYDFKTDENAQIVYVRAVDVADLPAEVRKEAEGLDHIYAIHNLNGERLALVRDRDLAFVLARQNDMTPVTVH